MNYLPSYRCTPTADGNLRGCFPTPGHYSCPSTAEEGARTEAMSWYSPNHPCCCTITGALWGLQSGAAADAHSIERGNVPGTAANDFPAAVGGYSGTGWHSTGWSRV